MSGKTKQITRRIIHNGSIVPLTERECQVLSLLSDGHTTKGIALMLNVSDKVIFFHRANLIRKLKTDSIAKFTKIAIRAGMTALALCLACGTLLAQAGTAVLISWDTPSPQYTNSIVLLVATTNQNLPINQWPVLMPVFSTTNISPTRQGVWTNLTPNLYLISATWTNTFWHTNSPFFSVAVSTPPLQTNLLNNLQISAP